MSSESVSVSLRCSLRTSGKGIDIYLPRMARPSSHLFSRRQSPPRATARMCPCPCALRSALSTARLPHESTRSKPIPQRSAVSACTLVAIPHAVKSAECRVVTKMGHHRAPSRILRKIREGQGNTLHRADGGSSDGKRGNFPLLSSLRDF